MRSASGRSRFDDGLARSGTSAPRACRVGPQAKSACSTIFSALAQIGEKPHAEAPARRLVFVGGADAAFGRAQSEPPLAARFAEGVDDDVKRQDDVRPVGDDQARVRREPAALELVHFGRPAPRDR